MGLLFVDAEHRSFFNERVSQDVYRNALFYLIGLCPDTRRHYSDLYDDKKKCIIPEGINAGWQTSGSVRVTRLAFNLFTDRMPTVTRYYEGGSENPYTKDDFEECSLYSVSDVFACSYAPYFVEAIKLRYPEYMREG